MSYSAVILPLALIVLSGAALVSARGAKWKIVNLAIVVGFMVAGFGIGFVIGRISGDISIGGRAATSLTLLLGCLAAVGCIVRNRLRLTPESQSSETHRID